MAKMKKADVYTGTSICSRNGSSSSTRSNNGYENVQQQQEDEGEEDDQPFSFPLLLAPQQVEEDEEEEDQQLKQQHELKVGNKDNSKSKKQNDGLDGLREMYIDMDIALPCAWESMKRQGSSKSSSADSQEFDFSLSLRALDPACDTPADELFYKGQLLPLQSRMKQGDEEEEDEDDEEEDEDEEEEEEDAKADSFSFKAQCGLLKDLDLGCMSPDRFPPVIVAGSDSRSSSFRSSSSYWDSGDKDSGDSSSSCRDSNGSSQDSCFEAPSCSTQTSAVPSAPCEQEKMSKFGEEMVKQAQKTSSSLNWRKSPFKWKVLLGGSKRASLSASSSCSSTSSASSCSRNGAASFRSLGNDRRRNHSFTFGSSATSASGPLLSSFFTGTERPRQHQHQHHHHHHQHYRHSVSASGGLSAKNFHRTAAEHVSTPSSSSSFHTSGSSFRETQQTSNTSNGSNKVLRKYLKLLKPLYEKVSSNNSNAPSSLSSSPCYSYSSSAASSQKKNDTGSYSHSAVMMPQGTATRSAAAAARSLEEWRAAMAFYDQQREQHDKELITCPSFLPGALRVSSFSSRRSSTHASCVTSSRSSPNHSGVLSKQCIDATTSTNNSSSSSMADLQSAIQGAIAHCKKSSQANAIARQHTSEGGSGTGPAVTAKAATTMTAATLADTISEICSL